MKRYKRFKIDESASRVMKIDDKYAVHLVVDTKEDLIRIVNHLFEDNETSPPPKPKSRVDAALDEMTD